jgi:hypothetical protein
MHRRDLLRVCGGFGTVGIAGCLGEPSENESDDDPGGTEPNGGDGLGFHERFEGGLGEWESAAAIGPEVDIEEFEWEVGVSSEAAFAGDQSVRIWNEGRYDDGTTWIVHPVSVESGQAYDATVSAQFWSQSESFNRIRTAVMRLGPEPPDSEQDFPGPGENTTDSGERAYGGLREALWRTEGWQEYSFEWKTPELATERLYLAAGTTVIWESEATHYVDEIAVEFEER